MILRKSLLYVFLGLLFCFNAHAQNNIAPLNFPTKNAREIFGGVSLISIHANEKYSRYGVTKLGFSVGTGFIQGLNKNFQLRSRILYERKGYKTSYLHQYDTSGNMGKIEKDVKQDFLTLSLVPQFVFGKNDCFTIGVGGYLALLLKSIQTEHYYYYNQFVSGPSTHMYYRNDLGISLTLGYSFTINESMRLHLQIVENYGLRKLVKAPSQFPNEKTSSLAFLIGISKGKKLSSR